MSDDRARADSSEAMSGGVSVASPPGSQRHANALAVSLNELRDEVTRIAAEHGFTDATIGEDCALIHSEVSELLEEHRAGEPPRAWRFEGGEKPCGIPFELADIIIRCLHFAGKHAIDIEQAVLTKMNYNARRPFRHGGKKL